MEHFPLKVFLHNVRGDERIGLVMLNSGKDLRGLECVVQRSWDKFEVRACADGGANTLFDNFTDRHRDQYVPDAIVGDLDSVRTDVKDYYRDKGTAIVQVIEQDKTDFAKCVEYCQQFNLSTLVVVNTLFGRMDHVLGNIGTLYTHGNVEMFLLSESSTVFVLQPGSHVIHVDSGLEEGHCGIVPLGGKCNRCTTTGLQWNLDNQSMELGGLISTCNVLASGKVTVDCTDPLLFTLSHNLCTK